MESNEIESNEKSTRDIWFAVFLRMKGFEVKNFEVIKKGTKGTGRFFFDISDEEWRSLKIECQNSDIQSIKAHMTSLKDMLY